MPKKWILARTGLALLLLLGCDNGLVGGSAAGSGARAAYLVYRGHPAQMPLLWQIPGTAESRLQWGTDSWYASGDQVVRPGGGQQLYQHTLGGLSPATRYVYRVSAGDTVYTGSFRAAPASPASPAAAPGRPRRAGCGRTWPGARARGRSWPCTGRAGRRGGRR